MHICAIEFSAICLHSNNKTLNPIQISCWDLIWSQYQNIQEDPPPPSRNMIHADLSNCVMIHAKLIEHHRLYFLPRVNTRNNIQKLYMWKTRSKFMRRHHYFHLGSQPPTRSRQKSKYLSVTLKNYEAQGITYNVSQDLRAAISTLTNNNHQEEKWSPWSIQTRGSWGLVVGNLLG